MADEIWKTLDGRKIAVGDMEEEHVRNALRMILRNRRLRLEQQIYVEIDDFGYSVGESQDALDAEARDHRGMEFNAGSGYWYYPGDRR